MDRVDAVVVGAGVVGLAIARALALVGLEVVIVEAQALIGSGVSSRNSEVIHAGLYYEPGSLKARLCVHGKELLYAYCEERGLPHARCGKLVVAAREQDLPRLNALAERARANGVDDVQLISATEARAREPALSCVAALWSPSSGIVDSHALMSSLLGDAEHKGAMLALATRVSSARRGDGQWICSTLDSDGGEAFEIGTRWLVNAAGLDAQAVALAIANLPTALIPTRHLAKGHYFSLVGKPPFSHLIYPLPAEGGLGVHLTLDLGGQARFGPDVEWLPQPEPEPGTDLASGHALDYRVDESRAAAFAAEIRSYWPALPAHALEPAYSGIRPKLSGPGQPAMDFVVSGPLQHGLPGLVNLFGIESPGLTAAMALGEHVATLVQRA